MEMIVFHIVQVNNPFLLCFADIDKLGAYFNNLTNKVVQSNRSHPVICRYGHAFLCWCILAYSITAESFMQNLCFLIEIELRYLHCCFRHPSVQRLQQVLKQSGQEFELHALKHLTKYCKYCQKHKISPSRFNFIINDDIDFKYHIIVEVLYIESKPVLHIVDEATRFQAGRLLKDIFARHVWDQLRACWINTYLGPPDLISANAGK